MITPFTKRSPRGLFTKAALAFGCAYGLSMAAAHAQITTVFYVLLENRCFTTGTDTSYSNILFQNKNGGSPFITSICTPGNTTYTVNYQGATIPVNAHTAFASCYHNAYASYNSTTTNTTTNTIGSENANNTGTAGSPVTTNPVHPSEPNYVFMEAGSNLSKLDDNDPYLDASQYNAGGSGSAATINQINTFLTNNPSFSGENLSALLQNAGVSWTSYTEGTCLLDSNGHDFNLAVAQTVTAVDSGTGADGTSGTLTNNISPLGVRTVPYVSFSGTSPTYTNAYDGTHQFNFAAKHTGQLFFTATNGGALGTTLSSANLTPQNSAVYHYAPLEQLASDLASNTQAAYCVITPDQYNDGHTALNTNIVYNGTTYNGGADLERIAQMDSFCSQIVPQIMASPVYQAGHAAIVLWTDETEPSASGNDFYHTLTEIVISPYTKGTTNPGGSYNSTLNYTHSSDISTMQKIFGVVANTASGYLNDAANPSAATPAGVAVTVNDGSKLQTASTPNVPYGGFGGGTNVSNQTIGGGSASDLSDLFIAGAMPTTLSTVSITAGGYIVNARAHTVTQTVTVTNPLSAAITNPVYLVLGNLSPNTSLQSTTPSATTGTSATTYPGSPYINVAPSGLASNGSATFTLHFAYPSSGIITDILTTVSNGGTP